MDPLDHLEKHSTKKTVTTKFGVDTWTYAELWFTTARPPPSFLDRTNSYGHVGVHPHPAFALQVGLADALVQPKE